MQTYQQAATYLGTKTDRPLPGRSTRLVRVSDTAIAVRYHYTNVVTYHADGSIVLRTGGYESVTTKARINAYTAARVYQRDFTWYLAPAIAFCDGMTIDATGQPIADVA